MSKGVEFLMKKNKIDVINGHGTLKKGKKVEVKDDKDKTETYEADHYHCHRSSFQRIT